MWHLDHFWPNKYNRCIGIEYLDHIFEVTESHLIPRLRVPASNDNCIEFNAVRKRTLEFVENDKKPIAFSSSNTFGKITAGKVFPELVGEVKKVFCWSTKDLNNSNWEG